MQVCRTKAMFATTASAGGTSLRTCRRRPIPWRKCVFCAPQPRLGLYTRTDAYIKGGAATLFGLGYDGDGARRFERALSNGTRLYGRGGSDGASGHLSRAQARSWLDNRAHSSYCRVSIDPFIPRLLFRHVHSCNRALARMRSFSAHRAFIKKMSAYCPL